MSFTTIGIPCIRLRGQSLWRSSSRFAAISKAREFRLINALIQGKSWAEWIESESRNWFIPLRVSQYHSEGKLCRILFDRGSRQAKAWFDISKVPEVSSRVDHEEAGSCSSALILRSSGRGYCAPGSSLKCWFSPGVRILHRSPVPEGALKKAVLPKDLEFGVARGVAVPAFRLGGRDAGPKA